MGFFLIVSMRSRISYIVRRRQVEQRRREIANNIAQAKDEYNSLLSNRVETLILHWL